MGVRVLFPIPRCQVVGCEMVSQYWADYKSKLIVRVGLCEKHFKEEFGEEDMEKHKIQIFMYGS